ncbi:MAG: non-ribosomal peptide synthetase [Herpetosiphonaceae bacterium]|nr:non-ribosomal peptide synthetase [Herpetosiphonaceae bacterium]
MKVDNLEDIYALSSMQKGMLFHTLFAPQSGIYLNQSAWIIKGELNLAAFQWAWQQVINRHTALRTAFFWEDLDEPLQVVQRQVELPLTQLDWRGVAPEIQEDQFATLLASDLAQGFQLSEAPLMRLALIRTADTTYRFCWSRHHLLLDGWSQVIVLKDMFTLYEVYCYGEQIGFDETAVLGKRRSYGDYIGWLQEQDGSKAEHFWRELLISWPGPAALKLAAPTPRQAGHTYHSQEHRLSDSVTGQLQTLLQQQQLTMNTLIQGAWACMLGYYSGQADVVFGVTVSGRPADLPEIESMVGLLINTLPMRAQLADDQLLLPWLKTLQAQQLEMLQYEYSSLVDIQGWSKVPREQSLFETVVVFENYPMNTATFTQHSSLQVSLLRTFIQNSMPLTVRAIPGQELTLDILYDSERFSSATISRVLREFDHVLQAIAEHPNIRLGDLQALLLAADQQFQLSEAQRLRDANSQKLKTTRRRSVVS